jgi:TonB family protein
VLQGSAIRRVEPSYPPLAKAARVSGSVVVEVTVDEEGNVTAARAVSGHPLLKDSAVTAARQWTFNRTLLQGQSVKVIGTITFNFNLADPKEIDALKAQIASNPNSPELYYKLGLAYRLDGRLDMVLEAQLRAVQLKPDYADAHYELGWVYVHLLQFDEAIDSLKLALALKGPNADVYLELSNAYSKADRDQEAIEAGREVLKLNPDFNQADRCYYQIGLALAKQRRYDEAVEALLEGAKLGPNQTHYHLYLGIVYSTAGNRDSAMKEYDFLKEKNSEMANQLMDFMKNQQ